MGGWLIGLLIILSIITVGWFTIRDTDFDDFFNNDEDWWS